MVRTIALELRRAALEDRVTPCKLGAFVLSSGGPALLRLVLSLRRLFVPFRGTLVTLHLLVNVLSLLGNGAGSTLRGRGFLEESTREGPGFRKDCAQLAVAFVLD